MENLISMIDFVLSKKYTATGHENYANFLKQPNEKWMFVPCDENGNVLEDPQSIRNSFNVKSGQGGFFDQKSFLDYIVKFEQAKERCLFEGFEIVKDKYKSCQREFIYLPNTKIQVWRKITFHNGEIQTFFFDYYEQFRTIEDLVKYNIQLTKTAQKQIGL